MEKLHPHFPKSREYIFFKPKNSKDKSKIFYSQG